MEHRFGGEWTEAKLSHISHYLKKYTIILSKRPHLKCAYIDAFAGSGYRNVNTSDSQDFLGFDEIETAAMLDGSARIALKTTPPFTSYVFIEENPSRARELENLKAEFPDREIVVRRDDANAYLQDLAQKPIWDKWRALVFLDPYGMQVDWLTIELLAKTKAIDLWYLFPAGIAVNRMLTRSAEISEDLERSPNESVWNGRMVRSFLRSKHYC